VHSAGEGDLVTDILHRNIEPATVELLRNHAGFMEAFHFPTVRETTNDERCATPRSGQTA
jgi:hypothetical protein